MTDLLFIEAITPFILSSACSPGACSPGLVLGKHCDSEGQARRERTPPAGGKTAS